VAIVAFASEEGHAWQTNAEQGAAKELVRVKYYTAYRIQVCKLERESWFAAAA
jgi:hypothetical protein